MADRQWVTFEGVVITEEGEEEYVTLDGVALSEDLPDPPKPLAAFGGRHRMAA
jgi:hypothetical protein